MKILGIDHGTKKFGIALLQDGELCRLQHIELSAESLGERLSTLFYYVQLCIIIHEPDLIAVERPIDYGNRFSGANARGQGYGIVHLVSHREGVEVIDITPTEGKKALTGKGNARKEMMMEYAADRLGKWVAEDAADAWGIALASWGQRS